MIQSIAELDYPTILVVDDNPAALYVKSRLLSRQSYRIIEADNGTDALTVAVSERPALILLDVNLSDISGFDVCQRLKAQPETKFIKVLQTSAARINAPDRVRSLEVGADAYLVEPAEEEELIGTVQALIKLARHERDNRRLIARLTESEMRYRSLIERMPAAMYTIDRDGRITFYNDQAAELWGRRPTLGDSESRFYRSHKLLWPDETPLPHGKTPMVDAVQNGTALHGQEVIIERSDGTRRHVIVYIDPLRNAEGQIVGAVNLFTDITGRKQVEDALREAQARLQRWNVELEQAVNIKTAELRQSQNRLRALTSELNLAEQRERKRLATELHDHLQQMLVVGKLTIGQGKHAASGVPACETALKKVDDILSDALTYSRTLVAELSPPVLRDHGLAPSLKWLAEYMKKKHEQIVTVSVPDDPGLDLPEDQRLLLFQSVRELLINSAKHAGTGQAVLTMEQRADHLCITVNDEGTGFDLAAVAAAGAPSDEISSKFGLYSIQERMRTLGGSFTIDTAPGRGTIATLSLPLTSSAETKVLITELSGTADSALGTQHSTLQKNTTIHVLLVDDHAMVRQGLRSVLDAYADIQVVGEARDGVEAVKLVEKLRPRAVVMDINMPKMNGIEATTQIKTKWPETAVIGISVNIGDGNSDAMRRAGAATLLTKDAAVEQLHDMIVHAVGSGATPGVR